MATIDPSLVSDPRKKIWVDEISEILKHLQNTDIEPPSLSIFQLPDTITKQKPEAYEPQLLGLGPKHHFRPNPYLKMEQKKLATVKRVRIHDKTTDFKASFVDKVEKIIPRIRSCYDIFLQDDDASMAWVFAIDGLFLYNILINCQSDHSGSSSSQGSGQHVSIDPIKRLLAQDIMMAENQIPFKVLQVIHGALNQGQANDLTPTIFQAFSEIHSPLELCPSSDDNPPASNEHLLHYMYYSIIESPKKALPAMTDPSVGTSIVSWPSPARVNFVSLSVDDARNSISNASDLAKQLPQKEIVKLFEQTITTLQNFSENKISIPAASHLTRYADFTFHTLNKHEGIHRIHRNEKVLHLPTITLNTDSEVILRNLVAYELLIPKSNCFPLTEYMGLMCGLVLNVEDAKLLKENNIIKGELDDKQVVKLFAGMRSSILKKKTETKSELQIMMEGVNEEYRTSIGKVRVWASFALEKLAELLLVGLTAVGSFVRATWQFVAFFISIATVFMLTYKAYYQVFGWGKTDATLLSYASN